MQQAILSREPMEKLDEAILYYRDNVMNGGLELSREEEQWYAERLIQLYEKHRPARELSIWFTFEDVIQRMIPKLEALDWLSDCYDKLVVGDDGIDGDIIAAVEENMLTEENRQLLKDVYCGKADPSTTTQRIDYSRFSAMVGSL